MADFDPVSYMMGQKTGGGGGGSSTLSGLTDVDISNPSNGQTLVYNSTSGKWENVPLRVLGVREVYDESTDKTTLSETWQTIYDAIREGRFVYIWGIDEDEQEQEAYLGRVLSVYHSSSDGYRIEINSGMSGPQGFVAASANDYPVWL